jgi:hypothetical protein
MYIFFVPWFSQTTAGGRMMIVSEWNTERIRAKLSLDRAVAECAHFSYKGPKARDRVRFYANI